MPRALSSWLIVGSIALVSCSSGSEVSPDQRAVVISTQACGFASKTTGSGVAIGNAQVLTVAHVVIGSSKVAVTGADGTRYTASIAAVDTALDLAVLTVPGLVDEGVDFRSADQGEELTVVGGASSGSVPAIVVQRAPIAVDEVRGSERFTRDGYELTTEIGRGDSGAGVFDADGRLAGVVFAVSSERGGVAWATSSDEILAMIDSISGPQHYQCDADLSRIVLVEQ